MAEMNRFSAGLSETVIGPGIGGVLELMELAMKARDATLSVDEQVRFADFLNFGMYNNPIWQLNLFYTRPALDYLILNSAREIASPGHLKRTAKKRKREYGQGFWNR